jgi:hypothetical protein
MEWIMDNIGVVLVIVIGGLFVIGLVLGLRSEDGRRRLAEAAVRFAVTALALAERWLGTQITVPVDEPVVIMDAPRDSEILLARVRLTAWLKREQ